MAFWNSRGKEGSSVTCRESEEVVCYRTLGLIFAGWFLIALFAGETELLTLIPAPPAVLTIVALTSGLFGAWALSPTVRCFVRRVDVRLLIALHLTRFVGFYFLFLFERGELPEAFALRAGWGDIVIAIGALFVISTSLRTLRKRAALIWNLFGFADILFVMAVAAHLTMRNPESMQALTRLPLSFLPTMLVPLVLTTHVLLFFRLLARDKPRFISADRTATVSENAISAP